MKSDLPVYEKLKKKYHKTDDVTNFKELLYRGASLFKDRTAFKLKNKDKEIYSVTYEKLKNDVIALGTFLISKGLTGKRICVIGKNSYKWAISYLASSIVGIVVPIDKELHSEDVVNFMNVSETECILGDNKNLNPILKDLSKLSNPNTTFIKFDNLKGEDSFKKLLEDGKTAYTSGFCDFDKIEVDPDELRI